MSVTKAQREDETTLLLWDDGPCGFDAGDANLRRVVGNDPTNATDPTGLWKKDDRQDDYWRSSNGKSLAKTLDAAQVYLTKTIDDLVSQLDKRTIPDQDKETLRHLLGEIKKRVATLVIHPVLDGTLPVKASQAAPFGSNGMYLDIFHTINVRSPDGKSYYSTGQTNRSYAVVPLTYWNDTKSKKEEVDITGFDAYALVGSPDSKNFMPSVAEDLSQRVLGGIAAKQNKDLPVPQVTQWESKQFASLMANEILHHLDGDGGWHYDREHAVRTPDDYIVLGISQEAGGYGTTRSGVFDFDRTLKTLDEAKDRPTFTSLLKSDAIFQAIYYGEWPTVKHP